jgi:hypothetical protein
MRGVPAAERGQRVPLASLLLARPILVPVTGGLTLTVAPLRRRQREEGPRTWKAACSRPAEAGAAGGRAGQWVREPVHSLGAAGCAPEGSQAAPAGVHALAWAGLEISGLVHWEILPMSDERALLGVQATVAQASGLLRSPHSTLASIWVAPS